METQESFLRVSLSQLTSSLSPLQIPASFSLSVSHPLPLPPPNAYHPSYTCIETSLAHPVRPSRANGRAAQRKPNFRQRRNKKEEHVSPFCFCDKPNHSSTSAAGTQNHSLEPFAVWFGFPDVIFLFLEDKAPRRQGNILAAKPVSWMKYERRNNHFMLTSLKVQ